MSQCANYEAAVVHCFFCSVQDDLLPVLLKFEHHLGQPPVIHNIGKLRGAAVKKALKTSHIGKSKSAVDANSLPELQHLFAEGPEMIMTDALLYPCIYYILVSLTDHKHILCTVFCLKKKAKPTKDMYFC